MVGGCFTDVIIHSSVSYHQKHALRVVTEPRWLYKKVAAACGAVIIRFHGVSNPKGMNLWSAWGGSRVVII